MLIQDTLEYFARDTPELPCLSFAGETINYGDMNRLANRFANGLLALGINQGERIGVIGENSSVHFIATFAAAKIGAIIVPINYRLAGAELEYVVSDSGLRLLIALADVADTLDAVRGVLPSDIILMSDTLADCIHWKEWLPQHSDQQPECDISEFEPCLQLYTSGTTGYPKGVVISQFNLLKLCEMNSLVSAHRASPGDAALICAPLFHIAGAASVVISVYAGQHALLHETFDPPRILDDMEAHKVATIFMVPAMIAAVLQMPGIRERDYSSLKQLNYGASPISETVLTEALDVFQCDFNQMYGMTETTGTVVCLSPADHERALAGRPELLLSCGKPSVGAQAKVMSPDGEEMPRGEVGEIWLKSPTNMLRYHNLPEATASCLTDGWVHTGDAGTMDEEGYLYLKDRIKDMVVSGAENIYPVEVENTVAKHPAVRDVAVIGVPDEKFGEALLAFIVLKPDAELGIDELVAFCRDKIAGYKIPRQMQIIDELPRNPSGKILKKILRQPFWEGQERSIS